MNNVLIYCYTSLGSKIAQVLKAKAYRITIVDYDETRIQKASEDGFRVEKSTLLKDEDLVKVGINKKIDALFCVCDNNKNNLFVTLSARSLNTSLKIIATSKSKAESKKLLIAGATKVLNPNEFAAIRIYRYITKPRMLKVLDEILFSNSDLSISEVFIKNNSLLNATFLKDMNIHKQFNILLLGIMDKELSENFIFNAKGINHKIDEGDVLVVMGRSKDLQQFNDFLEENANDAV